MSHARPGGYLERVHSSAMGGRINEKTLEGAAAPELSSVLHALFGMDHYPAYLHKWCVMS